MHGWRVGSIVVALVAAVLLGRMAVFMVDADRRNWSIQPSDPFRTAHSCLSAYAEAARFAGENAPNIYDRTLYDDRKIAGLKVDAYEYPPPFLLVPGALERVSGDFLGLRPVWFAMQLLVMLAACFSIARWLGPELRPRVLLATPLLFAAPATLFSLQMGNFQPTAVALAVIGAIALDSQSPRSLAGGAFALAYAALSKVFPGILALYLVFARRWRALVWTAAAGLVLIALALAVYGTAPFEQFVHYQLPRLANGEAFPQSEWPRAAAVNLSFYGLLVKLRALGLDGLDIHTGLTINSVYGLVVLALAGAVCWRGTGNRLQTLGVWLALVDLASFRSPFVGGQYGMIGTVWLAVVMLAAGDTRRERGVWAGIYVVLAIASFVIPTPINVPTMTRVVLAALCHAFMIGVNVWVCVAALLRARQPKLSEP